MSSLTLKPFLRANGTYDFPMTISVGEVYVFSNDRYKQNMLLNAPNSDYAVSKAYIEHLAIWGFEREITANVIDNKQDNIDLLQWIRAYGTLKVEITSEDIWNKLAAEYEIDYNNGIA